MRNAIVGSLLLFLCFFLAPSLAKAEILIQVQSGQDAAAAQKEADRLFQLGAPAFSRAEQVPDKGVWNRVYIGPFENEADANAAAEALKKQGAIKDFVVKSGSAPEVGSSSGAVAPAGEAVPAQEGIPPTGAGGEPSAQGGSIPVVGADGSPVNQGGSIPVISVEDQPAVEPGGDPLAPPRPFELPSAETPTYGEPISPEQAREMGLGGGNGPALPTYGESGQIPPPPSGELPTYGHVTAPAKPETPSGGPATGLPPEFKVGDDMPGMVLPPPVPATGGNGKPAAAPAAADQTSSLMPAPSAGEGEAIMLAQANVGARGNYGSMNLSGFALLVDLSSSMRRMAPCQGRIKEEAVAGLLRKMNRRIPNHPYTASLRVFGYKIAWTKNDFTTLYYGPATYNTDELEDALARLAAADSVSPFATAMDSADSELQSMGSPKAILMFADFESTMVSGNPVQSAEKMRRRYGSDLSIYTFYVTRQTTAARLAQSIAKAGGGRAYDICRMLDDEIAFENMMMDIFGPGGGNPCPDEDGDGVCDEDDLCPNTPPGAPVDERGCWIAAYSQFFDFDKTVVKSAFLPRIKHAAEVLNRNPGLPRVIIAGHTDNVGNPNYNMGLGQRRAEAVKKLLIEYGVAAERLVVESYGETRPVASNDTEEGRARNRRVEFHIGETPPHQNR